MSDNTEVLRKKAAGKRKEINLRVRLLHKRDIETWEKIKSSSEYSSKQTSEIVRQAIRSLGDTENIERLMETLEKRMSASIVSIHKKLNQVEGTQQIMLAFMEVLMRTYYFHTPSVPAEAYPEAIANANRRIAKFMDDVASNVDKGGAVRDLANSLLDGNDEQQ